MINRFCPRPSCNSVAMRCRSASWAAISCRANACWLAASRRMRVMCRRTQILTVGPLRRPRSPGKSRSASRASARRLPGCRRLGPDAIAIGRQDVEHIVAGRDVRVVREPPRTSIDPVAIDALASGTGTPTRSALMKAKACSEYRDSPGRQRSRDALWGLEEPSRTPD